MPPTQVHAAMRSRPGHTRLEMLPRGKASVRAGSSAGSRETAFRIDDPGSPTAVTWPALTPQAADKLWLGRNSSWTSVWPKYSRPMDGQVCILPRSARTPSHGHLWPVCAVYGAEVPSCF